MLDDESALAFVKMATANEDRAFEALLGRAEPQPVKDKAPTDFNPGYSTCESSFYFLMQQEHKMKNMSGWPKAVRDHEEARTATMRKALQDKFGKHFDTWYEKVKREHSHLA